MVTRGGAGRKSAQVSAATSRRQEKSPPGGGAGAGGSRARAKSAARTVAGQTAAAVAAATHLTDADAGAVEVLQRLAGTIDSLLASGFLTETGKFDNVSIPTYLRYCESLGLTPAGRVKLGEKESAGGGGKLAQLRAITGGKP